MQKQRACLRVSHKRNVRRAPHPRVKPLLQVPPTPARKVQQAVCSPSKSVSQLKRKCALLGKFLSLADWASTLLLRWCAASEHSLNTDNFAGKDTRLTG